jgi:hypothetical protein
MSKHERGFVDLVVKYDVLKEKTILHSCKGVWIGIPLISMRNGVRTSELSHVVNNSSVPLPPPGGESKYTFFGSGLGCGKANRSRKKPDANRSVYEDTRYTTPSEAHRTMSARGEENDG